MHWTYLSLNLGNDLLYYLFLIIQRWFKCEQRDDSNEPSSVKKNIPNIGDMQTIIVVGASGYVVSNAFLKA